MLPGTQSGFKLIGAGILVTLVPVLVGYFIAVGILKLNPVEALGYTGAYTYAFANVILTLAGTLIMLL